jgi:putative FmdB family regulatory protein
VPIYEYRCDECGDSFEILQRMADDPLVTCEKCGGTLRKVLHPVAIHFKGSGFYTTDYGKGSGRRPSGRDGSADGGESSGEGSPSSEGESSAGKTSDGEKASEPAAAKPAADGGKPKEKQKAT